MNGIDDLRSTLGRHAGDVTDHDPVERRTAVHQRIGVVRRRRRAAVAGGAVMAVVAGVAAATLGGDDGDRTPEPQPAERVFGQQVPGTMRALGFGYELERVVEGIGSRVEVDLGTSDQARLVTWTTETQDQRVRVAGYSTDSQRFDSADFDNWVVLGPEADYAPVLEILARDGGVAMAIYTLDPEVRPEGVTGAGATFRSETADQRLLDAVVGEPGQAELTLPRVTTDGTGSSYVFCTGVEPGTTVSVRVEGEGITHGVSCSDVVPTDVVSDTNPLPFAGAAGRDVTARLVDERGADVVDPDAVVALGVYADQPLAASEAPGFVERNGHLWRLVSTADAPSGASEWSMKAPAGDGPVVAMVLLDVEGNDDLEVETLGTYGSPVSYGAGVTGRPTGLVNAGDPVGYEVQRGALRPQDSVTLAFYDRAD